MKTSMNCLAVVILLYTSLVRAEGVHNFNLNTQRTWKYICGVDGFDSRGYYLNTFGGGSDNSLEKAKELAIYWCERYEPRPSYCIPRKSICPKY